MTDVRMLRGIAHPMRNRILEEMSAGGPMRAADVADRLGIPANQASFHLRQLAKYGLVEDAPELARDGRDRVWRVTFESGLSVNLDDLGPSGGTLVPPAPPAPEPIPGLGARLTPRPRLAV